jgi:hypothetical protein
MKQFHTFYLRGAEFHAVMYYIAHHLHLSQSILKSQCNQIIVSTFVRVRKQAPISMVESRPTIDHQMRVSFTSFGLYTYTRSPDVLERQYIVITSYVHS